MKRSFNPRTFFAGVSLSALFSLLPLITAAQTMDVQKKLKGFDQTVEKILRDWNVPGCGIGIVVKDKLVFARGYGYRDLENGLPVTPNTLFQIASNTKLFTATAMGFLVEEGKIDWDKPVRNFVPQLQFYNDELNASVTMRDMLSHRTGISRHDAIWVRTDFSRKELFDRIKYLEPSIPFRSGALYNNLMYVSAGQSLEYLSGLTWEEYVTKKIFEPLEMHHSMFVVEDMLTQSDYMIPYYEKRDTTTLLKSLFYTQNQGLGPAGSIISSINDLSNWVIAQINGGKFKASQVIPAGIIKETMKPAIPYSSVPDRYFENLSAMYGMGRATSSYKGHYLAQHGGSIGGIYSNISIMPADSIGVIVFTNRISQLPGIIAFTVYDRLLGLPETPWSDRGLKGYLKSRETASESRKKPDTDRIMGTSPSHKLADYAGIFEDLAYGRVYISFRNDSLTFKFNQYELPLYHYHYDRFMTPDDQLYGKWSLMFSTDAQGEISQIKISLDEKEVAFNRLADPRLRDPEFLRKLEGQYEIGGNRIAIELKNGELVIMSAPPQHLNPYKGTMFRIREFSDQVVEFILDESGNPVRLRITADGNSIYMDKKN
ncbi:MAG: serine hydrolase [Bacteroidales bacterium]|nr:serine hydrolase [Bacteroidales bacterium]